MPLHDNLADLACRVIRLLDLYDLDREPNNSPTPLKADSERRTVRGQGIWLRAGIGVLEYIVGRNGTARGVYIPEEEIISAVGRDFRLGRADMLTVLSYLATACRMHGDMRGPDAEPIIDKKTALLEMQTERRAYRLSPSGRELVMLSVSTRGAQSTADDVAAMISDLQVGKLRDFEARYRQLLAALDNFAQDLADNEREVRFVPDDVADDDAAKGDLRFYQEVFRRAVDNINILDGKIRDPDIVARIEKTLDDPSLDIRSWLIDRVQSLRVSIQRLGDRILTILALYMAADRKPLHRVRPADIMDRLWNGELSCRPVIRAAFAHGAWNVGRSYESLYDLPRRLRLDSAPPPQATILKPPSAEALRLAKARISEAPAMDEDLLAAVLAAVREGPRSIRDLLEGVFPERRSRAEVQRIVGLCFAIPARYGVELVPSGATFVLRLSDGGAFRIDDIMLRSAANFPGAPGATPARSAQ